MFREIRTSEKITDRFEEQNRNRRLMEIFDKRITDLTEEDRKFLEKDCKNNDNFDPDARIIV